MSMQDIVNDNTREGEKMLRDMKTATQPMNTSTNQSSIDDNYTEKLDEELAHILDHDTYRTYVKPLLALINRDYILKSEVLSAIPSKHICDDECNINSNEWRIGHKAYKDAESNVIDEIKTNLGLEK